MTVGLNRVYIGDQVYDEQTVWKLYFKKKQNQAGRFEFDVPASLADGDVLKKRAYLSIYVNEVNRFDGYITKIQKKQDKGLWHVEGKSIEGIFDTKVSGVPVKITQNTTGEASYMTDFLSYILFSSSKFEYDEVTITGAVGAQMFFYSLDGRVIIDHINSLAKLSGMTWKCYLDV